MPDIKRCKTCATFVHESQKACQTCENPTYAQRDSHTGTRSVITVLYIILLCIITNIHLLTIGSLVRGFYAIGGEALVVPFVVFICYLVKYWGEYHRTTAVVERLFKCRNWIG